MTRPATRLAKVHRPNLPDVVSRERLFNRLDEGRRCSIVWISGPPGSGKTTLAADYVDTWAHDCLWYQADGSDGDVATFFYYMAEAAAGREGGQRAPLPAFMPRYLNDLPAFTHRYFRQLFASLATPFALVIDNYHELPVRSRFHEVLRDGLDEVPEGSCVLITSRGEPPASFARLRANQQLLLLDWEDMRLTREEVDRLVDLRGHDLSETLRQQLYERTQGWAAGLVLMLEHMRGDGRVAEMPANFTPQVVFDYLAGEVLKQFDDDSQQFLLQTAVLPQITAELAYALTNRDDTQAALSHMTQDGYFVTSTYGQDDVIYTYHPLLREFLKRRCEEMMGKKALTALQSRAASLLENKGQIEDAISIRIENREWSELGRLLRTQAGALLEQGRGETLEQWLEELPRDRSDKDPWLLYWLGACRFAAAPRQSSRLYERAFELFRTQKEPDKEGVFRACAGVLEAILYGLDDLTRLDPWIEMVEQLIREDPHLPDKPYGEPLIHNMYMALVFRQPFHPEIERWGERTYAVAQRSADPSMRLDAAMILVSGIVWTGRFNKALELVEAMRVIAKQADVPPIAATTLPMVESMYYMLAGRYEECMQAVRAGMDAAELSGIHLWKNSLLLNGAGGALGAGDLDTAAELLDQTDELALSARRFDSCLFQYFSAWLAMLKGDVLGAYELQRKALRTATEMGLPFFEVLCRLGLAQILVECGDERKGVTHLRELRRLAKTIDNALLEFMTLLSYAHIALNHGRVSSGRKALAYAFQVGRERGFTHCVWWQPRIMAELTVAALRWDIEPEYAKRLIKARGLVPDEPPLDIRSWPWAFRVSTLGRFEIDRGAGPGLNGKARGRPAELLKVAVAHGGQQVPVERITDALWPRIDSDYAHRSFNTTLHRLRKLLGDDRAVILNDGKVSLDKRRFWVDTWALNAVSADSAQQLTGGRDDVLAVAERVLTLYQGPFLDGEDAAWALGAREELRIRFVRMISDLAARLQDLGDHEGAAGLLERGLEADDVAEQLYRALMLCYQTLERPAEAVGVFNRCRTQLAARLNVEPSRETRRLYEQISATS